MRKPCVCQSPLRLAVPALAAALAAMGASPSAAFAQPEGFEPRFWKEAPHPAEVMAATFLGGPGHEWIVSGGFQPDGTIVLVGNVAGPQLELAAPVRVVGSDLPAPPAARPVPQLDNRGNQRTDRQGRLQWDKPSWRHDGVTGFVVRLTSDLKQVISAHRFPWTSATVTAAAVGGDGSIYVAGRATEQIGRLGGDVQELRVAEEALPKSGRCQHTFVAKLSPDAGRTLWVRHARGPSQAPQVSLTSEGHICFGAQDQRIFDAGGKLLSAVAVPGGVRKTSSVSPVDGTIVTGGEHHWPTGREPWRCPTLNIHRPDGSLKYQLYDWGGPYVGLDNCRLVSDSAVRWVTHDRQGNILIYAWSDGGNSVMTREPADVRSGVRPRGLGITSAGAGVLSCAYIIKIEPQDYRVVGWTLWLGFLGPNKPNSVWIDSMNFAADGSIAIAGRAALGLWQTRNKLSDAPPSGEYIAVLGEDLSSVRFCSVVPGGGAAEVNHERAGWGIISGTVNGKPRVLFVGGATAEEESYGKVTATPTAGALQSKFGGGWCDGYVVMLDLSSPAPPATDSAPAALAARTPGPTSASFERGAAASRGGTPTVPDDGTTFHFTPAYPRWVTVDAEVRDQAAKYWPSFFYGRPESGRLVFSSGRLSGSFTVACTHACQPRGDQGRRAAGAWVAGLAETPLRLTLESFGPTRQAQLERLDNRGNRIAQTVDYCDAKGTLEVGGKRIAVTPRVTYGFSGPRGGGVDKVRLSAWLTVDAAELGLGGGPQGSVDLRISASGTIHAAPPPRTRN
jgi:hypothetical protein